MATFKPIISYKRADGTYRVQIRIIHNRVKKVLSTPIYITDKDITRGKRIKNQAVLDQLEQIISSMRERCNRYGLALKYKSIDEVAEIAVNDPKDWRLDFISYYTEYIQRLREQKRDGTANLYKEALDNFVRFLNRDKIDINEIDRQLIVGYARYLETNLNSGHIYFIHIKTVFNVAKNEFNDEDGGIIRIPKSPFNNISVKYNQQIKKRALTIDELVRFANFDASKMRHWRNNFSSAEIAKDLFLLSFYLVGMNLADMIEIDTIKDGSVVYYRKKTRDRRADRAEMRVKIPPEALPIMEKYKDPDGKRLLLLYHINRPRLNMLIKNGIHKINETLKIDNLTFYSARHTWATLAVNDCGIDKYTVHLALNHIDQKTAITDVYIEKDWKTTDQANRKVLDYCATFMQQLHSTNSDISSPLNNGYEEKN